MIRRLLTSLRRKELENGQALAESAFVFIIVLLLLAGLIEFGWAYFHYLAMQDAAGEGAAYGIMFSTWQHDTSHPVCTSNPGICNPDPNNIEYRVRTESQSAMLDWSDPTVTGVEVDAPFTTPGNHITVTVLYTHTLVTPLLTPLIPDGTITLQARAVQRILAPPPGP